MATTKTTEERFNGTGSQTVFPFTIEYLLTSDLQVFVNNALQTETTHYSISGSNLTFVTAPVSGTNNVRIARSTGIDKAQAVYATGSSVRALDLNNNQDQFLFKLQERENVINAQASSTAPTSPVNGDRWYDTVSGRTYVYYTDVDSSQWVEASPPYLNTNAPQLSVISDAQIPSSGISANKLSFTMSGSGAVARTVDSKLRDIVSVKDFNAKGDGVTDDTAAIQAAITEAKHVVFPEGTYLINNKLDVTQTDAYIEGLGTVEIKQTDYPQHVFFVSGDNCTIKNLKLTGVPTKTALSTSLADRYFGDTLSSKSSAIYLYAADNLDVIDCNIVKFFAGVLLKGGQNFSYKTGLTGDRMTTTTFELDSSDQQADDFWQGNATDGYGYIRVLSNDGSTSIVRLSDYVNFTNVVTFGTAQTDINLTSDNTFAYMLTKGRSKNILITGCRFDLVDMGILGNHVENLVIEDSIFETIEQTQQTNVRPHSIYLNGGDNKKVKASGLITYNSNNGDAYKFLATDGLFLSDLDAYNSRGNATLEGCTNVTADNLTCLLSGHNNDATTTMINITASKNVYLSDIKLTIAEGYGVGFTGATQVAMRPTVVKIVGTDDLNRGDLGTMIAANSTVPTDINIKDIVVDAQGYAESISGVTTDITIHDGEYSRSGSVVTISTTSEHGVKVGDSIKFDDSNNVGGASDGNFTVTGVSTDRKSFTFTNGTGTITGPLNCTFTNLNYKVTKSTFENISIVNGSASDFNAVRVIHGDNLTIRYPSYTKGDAPSTKQVQLGFLVDGTPSGCTNTTVVLHPDQSDFTFTNNGGTTNVLLKAAPQATGTWTPTVIGASTAGSATYANDMNKGDWTKIGDLVFINCRIHLSSKSSMAGDVKIIGLPFVADVLNDDTNAGIGFTGRLAAYSNVSFTNEHVVLEIPGNTSEIRLKYASTSNTSTAVDAAQITDTTSLQFSMTYRASSFNSFTPA